MHKLFYVFPGFIYFLVQQKLFLIKSAAYNVTSDVTMVSDIAYERGRR